MTKTDTLFQLVTEHFNTRHSDLSMTTGPGDLPAWDSLGHIALISKIEQTFDTKLNINQVMSINNIGDIVSILESLDLQKTAPPKTKKESLHLPKKYSNCLQDIVSFEATNIAIIRSSHAQKCAGYVQGLLSQKNITVYTKPTGEPKESDIRELSKRLAENNCDGIIAIGGGSVIDFSKLAWVCLEHPNITADTLSTPFTIPTLRKKARFCVIPTLFGSGSEASSAATFTKKGDTKKSITVSHHLLPDLVIVDPNCSTPPDTLSCVNNIFDALAHAIEGYVSPIQNTEAKHYAINVVPSLIQILTTLKEKTSTPSDIWGQFSKDSYGASIVQNHCSVGLAHSIAHQLTGFNIAHTAGVRHFLPAVIRLNKNLGADYTALAKACQSESVDTWLSKIDTIHNSFETALSSQNKQDLVANNVSIAKSSMLDLTFKTNPINISFEQIRTLIQSLGKA